MNNNYKISLLPNVIFFICTSLILLPFLGIGFLAFDLINNSKNLFELIDYVLLDYFYNTIVLCVGTSIVALLISIPTAWIFAIYNFRGKKILEVLSVLPMAMPAYILAYAYTDAFDYSGWISVELRELLYVLGFINDPIINRIYWPEIRSMTGACFVLGLALSPYIILLAKSAFQNREIYLIEAARGMGVGFSRIFFKIVLPLAKPVIFAGLSLVVMECLADYGTVSYFSVQTLSTGLYKSWFGYGNINLASLIGLLIFVVALFFLAGDRIGNRLNVFNDEKKNKLYINLVGKKSLLALVITGFSGFFGFIVPVFFLMKSAVEVFLFQEFLLSSYSVILKSTITSISFSLISLIIIILFSWIMVFFIRYDNSKIKKIFVEMSTSTYAIAGLVSALSLLSISSYIYDFIFHHFNISFVSSASILLLIIAYVSRYFAVGYKSVSSRLNLISYSLDYSAQTFGLSPRKIFSRLHINLLFNSSLIGGTLIFIDVMKELPATLVLRPLDFNTLAVTAYSFASDERLGLAAIPSLLIALFSIIPIIILRNKLTKRD